MSYKTVDIVQLLLFSHYYLLERLEGSLIIILQFSVLLLIASKISITKTG